MFIVGGGTYTEYHNLIQWSRSGTSSGSGTGGGGGSGSGANGSSSSLNALGLSLSGSGHSLVDLATSAASGTGGNSVSARRITYGATEILTPRHFLEQVSFAPAYVGLKLTISINYFVPKQLTSSQIRCLC